jgi:hypothetical protein
MRGSKRLAPDWWHVIPAFGARQLIAPAQQIGQLILGPAAWFNDQTAIFHAQINLSTHIGAQGLQYGRRESQGDGMPMLAKRCGSHGGTSLPVK